MSKDKKQLIQDQDIREEKIKILQEHFPGAVEEDSETGGYNLNTKLLQSVLDPSKVKEVEDGYELRWVGKKLAFDEAYKPNRKLIRPLYDDSKNFNDTNNILIKGDNLDALKILRQNYFGKIKMIYIDPPYNTKSDDFVYKDNFTDNDEVTLEKLDYEIEDIEYIKNLFGVKTHSGWLAFMYPRLLLAKDLLREDGSIFISIDENERSNLQIICNEIFGERNLINSFVWINNLKGRQISKYGASKTYEYILAYANDIDNVEEWFLSLAESRKYPNSYKKTDYEILEDDIGEFVIKNELHNTNKRFDESTRPKLVFCIHYNPATKDIKFSGINESKKYKDYRCIKSPKNINGRHQAWRWSKQKIQEDKKDLFFSKKNGKIIIYTKIREYNKTRFKDIITNISNGDKDLGKLGINYFDSPKPINIVKLLIRATTDKDDIVLDFFAGSGTTAQAVMELNKEDGGNRKFIMVQLAEEICEKKKEAISFLKSISKPANIFEICAERIRRAGDTIKDQKVDTGFKVFELVDDEQNKIYDVPMNKIEQKELIIPESQKPEDVLYSFMAADGIELDEKITCLQENKLYVVAERCYIFAEIEHTDLDKIKKDHPEVEYLSVYSPSIASDEFMLQFEDYAVAIGFYREKIKLLG